MILVLQNLFAVAQIAMIFVIVGLLLMQPLAIGIFRGMDQCLWLCAGFIPTIFLVIAAHELGHLVAGAAVRLPYSRFTVGPLLLERQEGRIQAKWNTEWFQPSAYVAFVPPDRPVERWRWAIAVGGGPLTNLLLSVVCLLVATWVHPGPPEAIPRYAQAGWRSVPLMMPGSLVTAQLNVTAIVSFYLCTGTLVPGRPAGFRTDGGHLLDLLYVSTIDLRAEPEQHCESLADEQAQLDPSPSSDSLRLEKEGE